MMGAAKPLPHQSELRLQVACALGVLLLAGCGDDPAAPKGDPSPQSADELIQFLEAAYGQRDLEAYTRLLANDPDHAAEFAFLLVGSPNEPWWDYAEENRIHRRMFLHVAEPGERDVPPQYWLQAISIALTKVTEWTEPPELYRSVTNPDGLPHEKWKAFDARYSTYAFFDMQTNSDFLVESEAIFTVIEDLEKTGIEPGRFLLLQWQDIDLIGRPRKEDKSWTSVKSLYR